MYDPAVGSSGMGLLIPIHVHLGWVGEAHLVGWYIHVHYELMVKLA